LPAPAFFIVEPRRAELEEVARLIDGGEVRPVAGAEFPLADALLAYRHKPARGKGMLQVGDRPARVAEEARRQAQAGTQGRKRVTPAALVRRAEMARLWSAGLTLAEIGRRFGVTRQAVAGVLRAVEGAAGGGE